MSSCDVQAIGPDRDDFLVWADEHGRRPDRAALADYLGATYPVRYEAH